MSAHMTEKGCEVEVGILRVLAADATAAIAQLFLFDVRCGTLRLAKHFFVESFQELLSQFNHLVWVIFVFDLTRQVAPVSIGRKVCHV